MAYQGGGGALLPEGLVLATNPEDRLWQSAEALECDVFIDEGYLTSAEEYAKEYEPYRAASDFIVALVRDEVAGAVRVIKPSPQGFKTVNDAAGGLLEVHEEGWRRLFGCDLQREVVECNIAVARPHRGNPFNPASLSNLLVSGAVVYLHDFVAEWQNPVERCFFLASLDDRYFRLLNKQYAPAVYPLGPGTDYLNSLTVPALLDCVEMVRYDGRRNTNPLLCLIGRIASMYEP